MSAPRAKIILHIGQHKTGSKALQSFCAHHSRALEGRGIFYPMESDPGHGIRAYTVSHYRLFALLRAEAMAACGDTTGSARFREEQRPYCAPHDSLRAWFDSIESRRARINAGAILISAEDVFDMHSAHEREFSIASVEAAAKILAALLGEFEYDPLIIVYLRRQDHLLGAHYVQFIKGSPVNDLDFGEFARAFAPRLHSCDILAPWASAFGGSRIRVRPYEPHGLPSGIEADFFEHVLGFPVPAGWAAPGRDVESVNATPSRDYIEFIRLLNRRGKQGLPVPRREDVLEAAFTEPGNAGIAGWMSPASRRALLEIHARGNAEIAERFGAGTPLFTEPPPGDDEFWREYPGLSAARAEAIGEKIRKLASPPPTTWRAKAAAALARLSRRR